MKRETALDIVTAAEERGDESTSVRENYSGRGMFGRMTTAVYCESYEYMLAILTQFPADFFKWDSMGRGYVIY